MRISLLFILVFSLAGCAHTPPRDPREMLREVEPESGVLADADAAGIEALLVAELSYLDGPGVGSTLAFGPEVVSAGDYRMALQYLLEEVRRDPASFRSTVFGGFTAYEAFGGGAWGEVGVRAYSIPRVPASRERTSEKTAALYAPPPDLVRIRFSEYSKKFPALGTLASRGEFAYGRVRGAGARGEVTAIEPYFTRAEIEAKDLLAKRKLELAWLTPADAERVRAAGVAELDFGGGRATFARETASNGRKVKSDFYSFFALGSAPPVTKLGAAYVDGRTAAADYSAYPKGALALLTRRENEVDAGRFIATLEGARSALGSFEVELYLGRGPEPDPGLRPGRLIFFAPKASLLDRLRRDTQGKAGVEAPRAD